MSQVETLPAINAIDFATVVPRLHHETPTWPTNLNDIRVVPWNSHSVPSSSESHAQAGDTIFPSLPPLYNGHPDIHLRNGIMEATRLGADHEPDAEKAFFVADLSQVYNQHMRWKACLPEIQPFYGAFLPILVSAPIRNLR
jgi:ornithine decarboxylase